MFAGTQQFQLFNTLPMLTMIGGMSVVNVWNLGGGENGSRVVAELINIRNGSIRGFSEE